MLEAYMPLLRFLHSAGLIFVLIKQHHFDKALERAAKMAAEEFVEAKNEN